MEMVARLAQAPLPFSCPTSPTSDCRLASCWSCWRALSQVADWGNAHLCTEFGPVGKRAIRGHFQRNAADWNIVRRGLLQAQPEPVARFVQPVSQFAQPHFLRALVSDELQRSRAQAQAAAQSEICAICFEECAEAFMVLECQHVLHSACLARWFRRNPACPVCRALPT